MQGLDRANMEAKLGNLEGEIIWSMFRCWDMNCNRLLTVDDHPFGRCGGCQGRKFKIATYLTKEEDELIRNGLLNPHKANLNEVGPEPPKVMEVADETA